MIISVTGELSIQYYVVDIFFNYLILIYKKNTHKCTYR